MAFLSIRRMAQSVIAVAEPMRSGWPAREPSPKKFPSFSIPIVASFPALDTTVSRTLPSWMFLERLPGLEHPGTDHIPAIPYEHICSDLCRPDLLTSKLSRCAPLSTKICVRVLPDHEPEAGVRVTRKEAVQ